MSSFMSHGVSMTICSLICMICWNNNSSLTPEAMFRVYSKTSGPCPCSIPTGYLLHVWLISRHTAQVVAGRTRLPQRIVSISLKDLFGPTRDPPTTKNRSETFNHFKSPIPALNVLWARDNLKVSTPGFKPSNKHSVSVSVYLKVEIMSHA